MSELTQHFCLNIDVTTSDFKKVCKQTLVNSFISTWDKTLQTLEKNPILRSYNEINHTFGTENSVIGVKNDKFRTALEKLRSSSHTLVIDIWRHSRPKINGYERLCHVCQYVEDDAHLCLTVESTAMNSLISSLDWQGLTRIWIIIQHREMWICTF